jgi:hypothetical protein
MSYKVLFGLALTGLIAATPARGDTIFRFDENGNWSINGVKQTPATLMGGVLTYDLGVGLLAGANAAGDVLVTEPLPGQTITVLSDLLRFSQVGTHVVVKVYSDNSDLGSRDLADTGLPTSTSDFTKQERGLPPGTPYTETGANGIDYKPEPGDPGYSSGATGGITDARYIFTSDTPEPTTLVLAGLGGLGLAGYAVRRRKLALA